MDTDFNGNIYVGFRNDHFLVHQQITPTGTQKRTFHSAFTMGVFGGLGSSFISPWTTNYRITDEYSGFIVSRGIAIMTGINSLTFGMAVGWDSLTDRDKDVWIYQNKAWYGLSVGLSIH